MQTACLSISTSNYIKLIRHANKLFKAAATHKRMMDIFEAQTNFASKLG